MTMKESRRIDRLTGKGIVLDNEVEISKVKYQLDINQEFIIMRTNQGISKVPEYQDICGHIHVVKGERNLTDGKMLILQIEDGRKVDFFAKSGNPVSGSYEIVVSGDFKDPEDE
jgi:hypothetical protein